MTGDEEQVLTLLRKRLERGYQQYGALDIATDTRDFYREALVEALDLAVYLSCKLIQLQQREAMDRLTKLTEDLGLYNDCPCCTTGKLERREEGHHCPNCTTTLKHQDLTKKEE